MAEIKSGVLLKLKDEFSKGMGKAAGASGDFSKKTRDALDKVNSAFSGTAAKIGAFGVSLSLGAAAKEIIELDHKVTRIGLTFRATAEDVVKLKRQILDTAQKYKISTDSVTEAMDVLLTNTGDITYAKANIDNMAKAIQGMGMSGKEAADMLSQFNQFGFDASQTEKLLDDISAMGDLGKATGNAFSKVGVKIMSSYGASVGKTTDDIKDLETTLLALMAGVGSEDVSATALEGIGAALSDTNKQTELRKAGIEVINKETGKLRSYLEIAEEIKAVAEKRGDQFWLSDIFGETGLRGMRALMEYGAEYQKKVAELGDTTGALDAKSKTMAGTLQSNLRSLQTAFLSFADSNLTGPLKKLTDFLNKLAEDPKRVEAVFNAIKRGLLIIGGVKIASGVMSFLTTLRDFKGGNAKITEQISLAGSAGSAMPVFVTNWGGAGAAGGSAFLGQPPGAGGLLDQYGNPIGRQTPQTPSAAPGQTPKGKWNLNKPNWKAAGGAAAGAAIVTAVMTVPGMLNELDELSKNEEMSKEEKSAAKGGAIGETVGSIGGAAAGALAGAAIGSVVPVVGTALGALVGGLIGQFGGPVGRFIGEKVGAAVGKEVKNKMPQAGMVPAASLPPQITSVSDFSQLEHQKVDMSGQAVMDVNVTVTEEGPKAQVSVRKNNIPYWMLNTMPANNTGHAPYARGMSQ
jgi:phage tail tape-measure protein